MGFLDHLKNLLTPPPQPVPQPARPQTYAADGWIIPTLLVSYFPVRNNRIDRAVTGDVDAPLESTRRHTLAATEQVVGALETGSAYHGYKDSSAQPSLRYPIIDAIEFLEPLPTWNKPGHRVPMTDYNAIMQRIDIKHWVENRGVKEVWLWGYHGGVIDLWETAQRKPFACANLQHSA